MATIESCIKQSQRQRDVDVLARWTLDQPGRVGVASQGEAFEGPHALVRQKVWMQRLVRLTLVDPREASNAQQSEGQFVTSLDFQKKPVSRQGRSSRLGSRLMGHAVALRDVLWMTFVMDLPKDQVAAALQLGAARLGMQCKTVVTRLATLNAARSVGRLLPVLPRIVRRTLPNGPIGVRFRALTRASRPLLEQTAWFLVPIVLVLGCSEAVIVLGLRLALIH